MNHHESSWNIYQSINGPHSSIFHSELLNGLYCFMMVGRFSWTFWGNDDMCVIYTYKHTYASHQLRAPIILFKTVWNLKRTGLGEFWELTVPCCTLLHCLLPTIQSYDCWNIAPQVPSNLPKHEHVQISIAYLGKFESPWNCVAAVEYLKESDTI